MLEAAFNRMEDEVRHFKLARGMARLFNLDIGEELRRAGAEFRSSDYLANLTQPTLGRRVSRGWPEAWHASSTWTLGRKCSGPGQSSVARTT